MPAEPLKNRIQVVSDPNDPTKPNYSPHAPDGWMGTCCAYCSRQNSTQHPNSHDSVPWPCPTVRAIDEAWRRQTRAQHPTDDPTD